MNAYCVILCRRPLIDATHHPRVKRFYVGAPTADRALRAASDQHPEFRVMGIEPSDLYPRLRQYDFESSTWQAA